jgi:trigger factor
LRVTTESLDNRQLRLIIEVDEERTQQAMRRAARQIARQVNIPGFRKGKAPYEVIVQRYGEDTVRQEAAEVLIGEVYREAVEQEEIKAYAPGMLEEVELDPVTFQFTISLPPVLDLGDYRGYRLKPRTVRVYKKEIQRALEDIRKEHAIFDPVQRPVALNDGALINLVGRTAAGIEFLHQDEVRVLLEVDGDEPAPGFVDALVGMAPDEERTFTLTLPIDFPQEELRGQEAEFTVKILEVYESTLPGLDDDLARTVGSFGSFKELEAHVKDQLRQEAQRLADQEYREQVLNDLLEQAQIEYPPDLLKEELDASVAEVERTVARETKLSLEDYLRFQNMTMEDLREDFQPQAVARLRRALMLGEIVRLEGIEVDEKEVSTQIEAVSAPWGVRAEEVRASLSSDRGREAMQSRLLAGKAVERLVAIARGEAPELVSEEEEGEAEDVEAEGDVVND